MDLIFEYLIVFILLFVANIAFLLRGHDSNRNKFIPLCLVYALAVFLLSFGLSSLNLQDAAIPFVPYVLFIVSVFMLILSVRFVSFGRNLDKTDDNLVFYGTFLSSIISIAVLSLALNTSNPFFTGLELAILSIVVMFLIYKISKIFKNAKRPYYAVVGEYMFLEFILLLILSLTFFSVRELDYSIFSSFLILTPTYQIMYMLLAIGIIFVLGVLYSDFKLKRLKRK